LTGNATSSFVVDAAPPTVTLAAPAGTSTSDSLTLSWNATDTGSGTDSYDVEVSLNGADFVPWLTRTTATSATYYGSRGNRYRFRIRARDKFENASDLISPEVVIAPADGGGSPPGNIGPKLQPANVGVRLTRRRGAMLTVAGAIDPAATGRLTVMWTARPRYSARTTAALRDGRFTARLKIPRKARRSKRATLTIRYPGDAHFLPDTKRLALRSR
jgi:hypothetical protein